MSIFALQGQLVALTAIVKVRTGRPKWLGTNKFVCNESHTGSKFS